MSLALTHALRNAVAGQFIMFQAAQEKLSLRFAVWTIQLDDVIPIGLTGNQLVG